MLRGTAGCEAAPAHHSLTTFHPLGEQAAKQETACKHPGATQCFLAGICGGKHFGGMQYKCCSAVADQKSVQPVLGCGGGCRSLLSPCSHTLVAGMISRKAGEKRGERVGEAQPHTAVGALHQGASDLQCTRSASSLTR